MRVNMRASEYESGGLVRHEFIKRIHKRFRQEGVVIPYPIRTIEFSQDAVSALAGRG
jgi:hypothetical protein